MQKAIARLNDLILDRDLALLTLFGNKAGEDKPYLDWLELQPCKSCGAIPHWQLEVFMKNTACHVRRVARGSGTGIKPPWNATTMCFYCHQKEHSQGQASLAPSRQFDRWADESLILYVLTCLRRNLGQQWRQELPRFLSDNLER